MEKIGIIAKGGNMDAYAVDYLQDVFFLIEIRPYAVNYHVFCHFKFSS